MICLTPKIGAVKMTGEQIKALRLKLKWSQERLARELGISVMTINRWEKGHFKPSPLAETRLMELAAKVEKEQAQG